MSTQETTYQVVGSLELKPNIRGKDYAVGSVCGHLTLLEPFAANDPRGLGKPRCGLFLCDCGNKKVIRLSRVFSGDTASCGCRRGENLKQYTTHGATKTREFHIWQNMLYRCQKTTARDYASYGAKGITVCAEWQRFETFFLDMGEAPTDEHSLDRKDNLLGYSPENCRWATHTTQMNNRSNTVKLLHGGVLIPRGELASKYGIPYQTLVARIKRGWSVEKALNTEVR